MSINSLKINGELLDAAISFGLLLLEIITDGEIHRVPTKSKPCKKNGWYVAFLNSPICVFGDWSSGERVIFKPSGYQVTLADRAIIKDQIAAKNYQKKQQQQKAAQQAKQRYNKAEPVKNHAYLEHKSVKTMPFLKTEGNLLLVPLIDLSEKKPKICNLQTIDQHGSKRFMKEGRVKGLCWSIGLLEWCGEGKLYLCEGMVTAISIQQHTKSPTVAALTSGNLMPVAIILKKRYPNVQLVIAGDDDWLTEQKRGINTGKIKATEVAVSLDAAISFPPFSNDQKKMGYTDWNDYFKYCDEVVINE
ncbi:conserved hypothetical protein [Psychromonas ingrahamii 37]|uniref:Toprim domain-containing protein n=1 Tax=Psychromonas ingrahamii (strain DSM 17664 / CCUG 51855 / 37) TaxID=357804 RepID=A1SXJ4_PSYIN|nr:toprim domain-containing protein [Psychromonas ingrahamii]ABM04209.1 conserved hypothetical protein [Psychromonas ingrahamii 37]